MRRLFCGLACICLIGLLDAEPQVTYLGDGRYACRGTIRECQSIQRRNDARELSACKVSGSEFRNESSNSRVSVSRWLTRNYEVKRNFRDSDSAFRRIGLAESLMSIRRKYGHCAWICLRADFVICGHHCRSISFVTFAGGLDACHCLLSSFCHYDCQRNGWCNRILHIV